MAKTYISWEEIKNLSDKLAHLIEEDCDDLKNATLIAVSRGGLVPAGLISYKLDIRDIRVLKLKSYDSMGARGEMTDMSTDEIPMKDNVYVIDDLADSGATFEYIKHKIPNAKLCSLYAKECCSCAPHMVGKDSISADCWLVFPWDE